MTNKIALAGLVAIAFVAGSLTTGSIAYAADEEDWLPQGKVFEKLGEFIKKLSLQVKTNTLAITDLETQIENTNQTANTALSNSETALETTATHIEADQDLSPTNEVQTLSINGNSLTISNGNKVTLPSSVLNIVVKEMTFSALGFQTTEETLECDPGTFITGGSTDKASTDNLRVKDFPSGNGWKAIVDKNAGGTATVKLFALCAQT